ncbi:hypothetical protein [Budvicia aquatica]|uniref:Flp pilus assembly protein CpaB n=1 Tax=Budvicia aquatica TaxID=82979 RepID=A0A2C6DI25_9GAMM|nr:hypothetical protein [Budvicia aquatica]PHI29938.1 hypothetical protein CRN84_11620 [Budvicia aquatica]VFS48722.1 Flp pilus assembly protein CpaB [Budvicia aquatica]
MKRKLVIVYILMILVGVVGIFVFSKSDSDRDVISDQNVKEVKPFIEIKKIVLTHDLRRSAILSEKDYRIETIKKEDNEVTPSERSAMGSLDDINGWALKTDLKENSQLTTEHLAKPGTGDYFELFLMPGNVIYTFTLQNNENYLLDNIKVGTGVDIYLIYGREVGRDMRESIVSPPTSITGRSLKRVISNKRVLSINKAQRKEKDGVYTVAEGSQIVAELNNEDVKILKGLEMGAKLALFPATEQEQEELTLDVLLQLYEGNSGMVEEAPYLPENNYPSPGLAPARDGVTELRG